MDPRKLNFLISVLGSDGAQALAKAAERNRECENVLVPRTILAWLNLAGRSDYEGGLPGVENTYLNFRKSEDQYTGSVSIGNDVYSFDKASLVHLASAIAVSIGVDADAIHPDLRDLDLVRLGKSIDLLVKARHLSQRLAEDRSLAKAISLIPPGPQIKEPKAATSQVYDYSHVLSPQLQKRGYKLQVRHSPDSSAVSAHVFRNGLEAGAVTGSHEPSADGRHLDIDVAEVNDRHQGQGLGTALYEALMAHAHHSGIKTVSGGVHSTSASAVHQKLSAKHGMDYKPVRHNSSLTSPVPEPYDNRYGKYQYTIKEEIPANKAENPGPAHAPTPPQDQQGPTQPTLQTVKAPPKPKRPQLPKVAKSIKITKSESERKCGLCGLPQFRGGEFRGCLCLRDLVKHARAQAEGEGFSIQFRAEWDEEAILTLLEAVGRK